MTGIGMILGGIAGVASLVCLVMVLIKMFQTEKPLMGILGILTCGIWAYIWGWMKNKEHGLQKIMIIWSIAWVVGIIGNMMSGIGAAAAMQEGLETVPTTPIAE